MRHAQADLFDDYLARRLHRRVRAASIDWASPDEELFRFHTEQDRELGGHLLGRRLYETMLVWETVEREALGHRARARVRPHLEGATQDRVLDGRFGSVEGNARLAQDGLAEEVARLKEQPGKDLGGRGRRDWRRA